MKHLLKTVLSLIIILGFVLCSVPLCASGTEMADAGLSFDTQGVSDIEPVNRVFYMPSTVSPNAVKVETDATSYKFPKSGRSFAMPENHIIDITAGKTTDSYGNVCYKVTFEREYTFYFAENIPAVYVATSRGLDYIRSSRDNRDTYSRIIITDEEGNAVYNDVEGKTFSEIKGRGNASFSNEKKPFQIKLAAKTNLFDMGKSKTWILLANYNDASYVRNACAYRIAEALEIPYTPQSTFVDLYIDNQYQGLYQLCEKTQIGKNRVEITDLEELNEQANQNTVLSDLPRSNGESYLGQSRNLNSYSYTKNMKNPDDITGGYLVELDNLYSYKEPCTFSTGTGNTYTVKSPEYASKEEMQYVSSLFANLEEALYSKTGYDSTGTYYTDYADLESLVKFYIVEEISKDWDSYNGSVFFYKDVDTTTGKSKIYAGPVWDFDNTWGNIRGRGTYDTDLTGVWAAGANTYGGSDYNYGWALMQHEDAKELCAKLYPIAAKCLGKMLQKGGEFDKLIEKITPSAAMDMSRWPVEKRDKTFIYFTTYNDDTVSSAVGYLKNFMIVRTEALLKALGCQDTEWRPAETEATTASTVATTTLSTTAATTVATTTVATTTAVAITTAATTSATVATTSATVTVTEPIVASTSEVSASQSTETAATSSQSETSRGTSYIAAILGSVFGSGLVCLALILNSKKKKKK